MIYRVRIKKKNREEREGFAVQFNVLQNLPLLNSYTSFKNIK